MSLFLLSRYQRHMIECKGSNMCLRDVRRAYRDTTRSKLVTNYLTELRRMRVTIQFT